jgi:hypothetical protein
MSWDNPVFPTKTASFFFVPFFGGYPGLLVIVDTAQRKDEKMSIFSRVKLYRDALKNQITSLFYIPWYLLVMDYPHHTAKCDCSLGKGVSIELINQE